MIHTSPPLPLEDLQHILDHTLPLWEEIRGRQIFITGGTGFFGSWLLESFLFANERLKLNTSTTILSRNPGAFLMQAPYLANRKDIRFIAGDIRGFVFPDGNFPFVIHAATDVAAKQTPLEQFSSIVGGTQRMIDFAAKAGTQKFLLVSSAAVYGAIPANLREIPENQIGCFDPINTGGNFSTYSIGKLAAEHIVTLGSMQYDIAVKFARCFAFVGPKMNFNLAVGSFIRDAMAQKTISINGDGTPVRSYLYAADLAIWLWTILFKGESRHAYNVGSSEGCSLGDTAKLVKEAFDSPAPVQIAQTPLSGQPISYNVPDISRSQRELHLQACVPLAGALVKTAKWYKQIPSH